MKGSNLLLCITILLFSVSCGNKERKQKEAATTETDQLIIPIDKGFSEYISGYTSGIIPANAAIEIRFTPEFAARADKKKLTGLFVFKPAIKGTAEWSDDLTLVFKPAKILDPGKTYSGELNLSKLAEVNSRLKVFPIRVQTLKKDFQVVTRNLEYAPEGNSYNLQGEIITSDYVTPAEVETYLTAEINRKALSITWDHSSPDNIHKFIVIKIDQTDQPQELLLNWAGAGSGVKQKGSTTISIPKKNDFIVHNIVVITGENQRIDIVLSEPVETNQELEGLIWFSPAVEHTLQVNSNIISVFPATNLFGTFELNIEAALKSARGINLPASRKENLEFETIKPEIQILGKGVILPASGNLVFPFKAANLRAVDLKIIKIFENNLPYFLQNSEINDEEVTKRFGRPVYAGKVDLMNSSTTSNGKWNLYTIDLSDYIDIEPGVLYKVQLGMRKSYSLYACGDNSGVSKYEEMLTKSEEKIKASWDDPDNYYGDYESSLFYQVGYDWETREDPCKEGYYSPDKNVSRNVLASNLGLIAKKGQDDNLLVIVNDIRTTEPVSDAAIEVYDLQMQLVNSGTTSQTGSLTISCSRKPFLIVAKKGNDRNYLKTNDGSSLSLSSFDVTGVQTENGIKAFIYGERDVWRPGDSIYLTILIRDKKNALPTGHPVQFELINPLEQRVDNQVQNLPGSNVLVFSTKTSDNAITGNYNAVFKIGGASFSKKVRIETVKPNRLKIDLSFPTELLGGTNEAVTGEMKVKWLNGAVAKNLNTTVELLFRPVKTVFEKYPQYNFDDPATNFSSVTTKIFDATIDDRGNAYVTFSPVRNNSAPGMLTAIFITKVFEKGGDASIIQKNYKYAPYTVFAGINLPGLTGKSRMLFTDADNEVKIVTVDQNGKPVRSEVEVNIYKISYRWWWEGNDENLGRYVTNRNYKPVISKKVTTTAGEGSFSFKIDKYEWGRYLIRVTAASGHTTGKVLLVDWPWDYGSKGNSEGATLLTINTDKEKYNVGDNIQLSFPAPENARAIITLENAIGVVEEIRVNATGTNTLVNIKARPDMAPNVYAYVTLIQPHAQTVNDMPVRLYGVIPVMVEDPETRLKPQISMPDEVRSQQAMEIKISEANNKAMTYTLAIVDEGLLDITGYKTPDPWGYFYAREALGVRTWDIYDYVLGAFGGTLDRAFAVGGDEALKDNASNKAKRFIPVVKFFGPFELTAGKTNTHKIILPLYTGSVKTMVIAGKDRAFGYADKSVFVRDPLMILATAPRVLSPGEKVSLPVTLFVQKDNIRKATIVAEGNDLIRFTEKQKEVTITEIGEKDVDFEFTTADVLGKAEIKITASGGGETAVYKMEIEVRSPNPPETRSEMKILMPKDKYDKTFKPFGMEGTGSAVMEVSALPSVNLKKRLSFLIDYPHGCSEQVTSAVFPQLWLKDLTKNNDDLATKAFANIASGIRILQTRQMGNGGIALWPGSSQPDNWVTSYAGHFMLEAEKLGYSIPSGLKQKWLIYQKKTAQSWRFEANFKQSANDQAYRLFTLALAGQPDKGAMNRLRESPGIPQLSKWLLAASFALTGRTEVAEALIDVRSIETEPDYYDYYYGSYMRDRAVILYTLTVLKKAEVALPLLKDICDKLNKDDWYSTQTVAWSLFAYMKFAEMTPTDNNKISKVTLTINGEKKDISINSSQLGSETLKTKAGENTLKVENVSENPVYMTFIQKGVPLISDVVKEDKGLIMKVEYLNMEMKPVDEKSLEQGTDFAMVVKVTNNTFRRVENIALTQMVPSGWEIQNTRMYEADWGIKENSFDYRDFRDDRVYTYFALDRGETKTFVVILNAAYKGTYFQPSVWCEAMYIENCYSRIPGKPVFVTGQKIE